MNQDIEGKIWVDNLDDPKMTIIVDNIRIIYLLGSSSNEEFNIEVGEIIRNIVFLLKSADVDVDREWVLDYYNGSRYQKKCLN